MKVFYCECCGLLQSHGQQERDVSSPGNITGDAGWSNVRHGKSLRGDKVSHIVLKTIEQLPPKSRVLDVGSSRGRLLRIIANERPDLELVGIEPHLNRFESTEYPDNIDLFSDYLENIMGELGEGTFDLMLSVQSLEHHESPTHVLSLMGCLAKKDCILIVDVPSLSPINEVNVIEELFIDTHLSHFDIDSLSETAKMSGWQVTKRVDVDGQNLTLQLHRTDHRIDHLENQVDRMSRDKVKLELDVYRRNLTDNRTKLRTLVGLLHKETRGKRCAIWGCGRQLEVLVRVGGLDVTQFLLIDNYLEISPVEGRTVVRPSTVDFTKIDVVLVCGNSSVAEIKTALSHQDVEVLVPWSMTA